MGTQVEVSKKAQVYNILKERIIQNELTPQEYLNEQDICEELGVRKTPVREVFKIREILECAAARLAAGVPSKSQFVSMPENHESFKVVNVGGEYDFGYWGGMMAAAAKSRGLAGLAIDGCVRNSAEIARLGFPIFCRGFCVRGTTKSTLGLINYPQNFGLQTIFPGDLVLGEEPGNARVAAHKSHSPPKRA